MSVNHVQGTVGLRGSRTSAIERYDGVDPESQANSVHSAIAKDVFGWASEVVARGVSVGCTAVGHNFEGGEIMAGVEEGIAMDWEAEP
jgi:hypothetical protein